MNPGTRYQRTGFGDTTDLSGYLNSIGMDPSQSPDSVFIGTPLYNPLSNSGQSILTPQQLATLSAQNAAAFANPAGSSWWSGIASWVSQNAVTAVGLGFGLLFLYATATGGRR